MPRADYAIIHRSFWPQSEIIGEALLQLAEILAKDYSVVVVAQSSRSIAAEAQEKKRGKGVLFHTKKSRSDSSSSIFLRILDSMAFGVGVFYSLIKTRPKKIYMSTDPPVFVPLVIALYSVFFGARYVYHLQDIHPEATSVVVTLNPFLLRFLKWIDSKVIKRAALVVTLNEQMASYISKRALVSRKDISLLTNAAVTSGDHDQTRRKGIVFVGNLGRLQLIPLVIDAVREYEKRGGVVPFVFAGGGVFSHEISKLSTKSRLVSYCGRVSVGEANDLLLRYKWSLLPIDDRVLNYAFPSKTSTYAANKINVLSVSGPSSSVANWVNEFSIGFNSEPNIESLVEAFFRIETQDVKTNSIEIDVGQFQIKEHVKSLLENMRRI